MIEPAGRWLRVSTGGQDEGSQIPTVDAWLASHGYTSARDYIVHGASAFKGNGKFDKMWAKVLEDMRTGVIRVLVVWKSDRLDRKLNMLRMLSEVAEAGGRVEFVTETHLNDLTTMAGRISLKIAEEIAHQESQTKSDRVRIKQAALILAGSLTNRPPWGYAVATVDGLKTLVPTAEGRAYVPEIFARVIKDESLAKIALWLDSAGVTPPSGKHWIPKTLGQMIRRMTYTGRQQDGTGHTVLRCEALVDAATWKRANKALSDRPARRGKRPVSSGSKALLASVLYCPKCSGPMYRIMSRGYAYYRCAGKGAVRRSDCKNMVKVEFVDALADEAMATLNESIFATKLLPGTDWEAEIQECALNIRELDPIADDYSARHAELMAHLADLKNRDTADDEYSQVDTGETYASRWAGLEQSARGEWLRSSGVRFYASKDPSAMSSSLVARIAQTIGAADDDRYAFRDRDGVYLAIYFGSLAGLV